MNPVFDSYALYYDLLYRDKDYQAEAEYVALQIRASAPQAKRILELGCGTGAHAEQLARLGFDVVGVDMSEGMLACAEARKANLPIEVGARLTFVHGDVRSVRTGKTYDAVISLFHVISYQATNADLAAAFITAAIHLTTGGVFLYDYWYGPAVLLQKPEVRVKRLEDDKISVTRIAEPLMQVNENIVTVDYTVFIEDRVTGLIQKINEAHRMRYLFIPELTILHGSTFERRMTCAWMDGCSLDESHWSGCDILIRP